MLLPEYTSQFKKDLKTLQKRQFDIESLKDVIRLLCSEAALAPRHRDHQLTGNWRGRRECHISPDWLLIYKTGDGIILFERTGSHSDIFSN